MFATAVAINSFLAFLSQARRKPKPFIVVSDCRRGLSIEAAPTVLERFIMFVMKRSILAGSVIIFALLCTATLISLFKKATPTDFRLARGRAQLYTENYLAALQTLRDIPDSKTRSPEAHSYLGAAYLKLHLYKAAIKEFEEAGKQRSRVSDPWIGLASSYLQLGDLQNAIDSAKRATEIETRSAEAWIALGRAQWQQRDFDEAEKAALKARELDPASPAVSDRSEEHTSELQSHSF